MLGRTVRELLASIDSHELAEWLAYCREFGPWWSERGDLQTGAIAAMIGNVHRRRGAKPFTASDFVIRRKRQPSQSELKAKLLAWVRSANGNGRNGGD